MLKPNGVYIFVSFGGPERRLVHLQDEELFDWEIRTERVIKMR